MKVSIYDVECLKGMFLLTYINEEEPDKFHEIEIRKGINQIDKLRNLDRERYWVGFNNIAYDANILEYIIRSMDFWGELSSEEICEKIHLYSNFLIQNQEDRLIRKTNDFTYKQIDLFLIWHFDNKNRKKGLKEIEYYFDMENIEEMPISPDESEIDEHKSEMIKSYCRNDVTATYNFWLLTRGKLDGIYKGKDKIQNRLDIMEETGLDCLNWNDVRIGDEWNKKDYKEKYGEIKDFKVVNYFGIPYRQFFPNTVKFKSVGLKQFVNKMGGTFVLNKKQTFTYKFNDELIVNLGKGGIHSCEKERIIRPADDEYYIQIDISGQYPNAVRKYKIEPPHLPGWSNIVEERISKREYYKKMYKETKERKYDSLQEICKYALNGGSVGRLKTQGSWQEYPYGFLKVTIGCQLEILSLIENLLDKGFRVVSANTDGIDVIVKKHRHEEFKNLIADFEKQIGNNEMGKFEFSYFKLMVQTSVNDYLALKEDGTVKTKGDFEIDKEIHKNKSMRIVPIALYNYFVKGIPVKETILNHKNIYDFTALKKSDRKFHFVGIKGSIVTNYKRIIRYIVTKGGEKLYRVANKQLTDAPEYAVVESGKKCTVLNRLKKDDLVNIDYDYYIEKVNKIISKIEKTNVKHSKQLSLW